MTKPMITVDRNVSVLKQFEDAGVDLTRKVRVYWNLHKNCFSVKQNGIVKAHTDWVCLKGVEFKVSQKGRERVLREKRKNVHAYAVGYIASVIDNDNEPGEEYRVTYNPYKNETFVTFADGWEVDLASTATLHGWGGKPEIYARTL